MAFSFSSCLNTLKRPISSRGEENFLISDIKSNIARHAFQVLIVETSKMYIKNFHKYMDFFTCLVLSSSNVY